MAWLPIALGALALLLVLLLVLRWRRGRSTNTNVEPPDIDGDEIKRLRAETALSELRDMREALGPVAHNRVERRRNPQAGTAPKIERRKKGGRRSPE